MENPTSLFSPDYPVSWDNRVGVVHSTSILRSKRGREQRWMEYPTEGYARMSFTVTLLTQEERRELQVFMNSVRGAGLSFYIYEPFPQNYSNVNVGTVTAANNITIPYMDLGATLDTDPATFSCAVGGVPKSFTVTERFGTYGEAKITFSEVLTGAVTMTMSARKQIIGRFEADENLFSFMQDCAGYRSSLPISIQGL